MKTDKGIVENAKRFATRAHSGQFLRNRAKDPFITHPERVVALVEQSGGTAGEIAAAWLHDVVEDTQVTLDDIRKKFGDAITEMVDGLTDPPHFAGNPDKIRKAWQAERVISKSASVKRVKIADQTANSYTIGFDPPVGYNPQERLDYLEGARSIVLNCGGISKKLDKMFEKTYQASLHVIRAEMKK